jgi:23S rRNA U2552 (ribose-2'-O)-methylase RlmE/FtsJ
MELTEPPWEISQCIPFQGQLPRLTLIQGGWKEQAHSEVMEEKNKISEFEAQDVWELRKKITNPYEAIFSGSSDTPFPSLAQVQPLSRSYFKMIEMLDILDFWKSLANSRQRPFRSAHVCEGPGGFIQATIQGLYERKISIDAVYAMTLRPTKSHIPGWRRSIKFLRKYPQIQLEYGADDTGNILSLENQRVFCAKAAESSLFTADGGFDFSIDYTKQEEVSFPLLLASFTMGLKCLAKGGTMIIKLFDIYSEATQDLFLGSARLFEKFTIYKPATSRPCNAERYFMATGYVGSAVAQPWIAHLQKAQIVHTQSPLTRLTSDPWIPAILEAVQEQIRWQESQQIQTIQETLTLDLNTLPSRMEVTLQKSKQWCERFKVPFRMDG